MCRASHAKGYQALPLLTVCRRHAGGEPGNEAHATAPRLRLYSTSSVWVTYIPWICLQHSASYYREETVYINSKLYPKDFSLTGLALIRQPKRKDCPVSQMQSTYTVLLLFGKSATPIQKLDTSAGSESAATIKRLGKIVGQLRQMWAMIADQKQHCMSKILLATAFVKRQPLQFCCLI